MMVSSMPCWKNNRPFSGALFAPRWLLLLLAAVSLLFSGVLTANSAQKDSSRAQIVSAFAEVRAERVMLDLRIELELSPAMREALDNGIALEFEVRADLGVAREWLWDQRLAQQTRRYRLAYHALSENWMLTDLTNQEARTYSSLNAALEGFQHIQAWPVAEVDALPEDKRLVGRARVALLINQLPLPLRLPALMDSEWSLKSKWYLWGVSL